MLTDGKNRGEVHKDRKWGGSSQLCRGVCFITRAGKV